MSKKSKRTQTLSQLSVAIYPGFGLVQGTYEVYLEKGDNKFQLQGLPTQLDSDSVYVDSFEPATAELLGSSYRAANLNAQTLQTKAVDGKVTLYHGSTVPSEREHTKGRLLSLSGNIPGATAVIEVDGDVQIVPNVQSISLPSLPDGLSATPSLMVKARAEKKGWYKVRLLYKTRGMSWSADTKWVYNPKAKTVTWDESIKVNNNSGTAYNEAVLRVVAGDVGNQHADFGGLESVAMAAGAPMGGGARAKSRSVAVENLGQVKAYKVPELSTIPEGERQTLPFLTRTDVPVEREYRVRPVYQWHAHGNRHEHDVRGMFLLKNDDAHKLGLALPATNVQVMQRSEDSGDLLPTGGGWLTDTAVGEDISFDAGSEFDLKAVRIVKSAKPTDGEVTTIKKVTTKKVYHTRECVVELFNGKDEEVTFVLEEALTANESFKGEHNLVEVAANQFETRVKVAAGKTESVSFTVVQVEEVEVEAENQTEE